MNGSRSLRLLRGVALAALLAVVSVSLASCTGASQVPATSQGTVYHRPTR